MSVTRRELLEKSSAFAAAIFLSGLRPALQRDRLAGQINLLAFTHVTVVDATGQPALCDHTVIVAGDRILLRPTRVEGRFQQLGTAPSH
jgi:hypothetical protein